MYLINLQDIASIIGALADAIASGLIALYYGFIAFPTGFAFAIGAVLAGVWGLVTPISFQAESIVLVGGMGKNLRERLTIVVIGGVIMTLLGTFGLLGTIVDYIGDAILAGMLAGVGVILARTGINLAKEHIASGVSSFIIALVVWFTTYNLAYMIVTSLIAGALVYNILVKRGITEPLITNINSAVAGEKEPATLMEKFKRQLVFQKPILNSRKVWTAALALAALQIGANISYGTITSDIAATPFSVDKLTVMSGLADTVSALFGGAPMESIVAVTATAAHPVQAGVAFMAIMAIILFSGLLPKIAKYIPVSATSGYLFIIGAFAVLPDNLKLAVEAGDSLVGIITFLVTVVSDPFLGMIAGILARFIM